LCSGWRPPLTPTLSPRGGEGAREAGTAHRFQAMAQAAPLSPLSPKGGERVGVRGAPDR